MCIVCVTADLLLNLVNNMGTPDAGEDDYFDDAADSDAN